MLLQYLWARFVSLFSGLPQLIGDLARLSDTGVYFGSMEYTSLELISAFNSFAPLFSQVFYEFVAILCILLPVFLFGLVVHKGKTHLFQRSVSTSGKALFILGIFGLVSWIFWIIDCHIFDTWYGYNTDSLLEPKYITGQGLFLGVIKGVIWIAIGAVLKNQDSDLPDESDAVVASSDPEKKYICTACGNYRAGWYQACPNCGVVGKMVKATPQIVSMISNTSNASNISAKSSSDDQKNSVTKAPHEEQNPSASTATGLRKNNSTIRPVEDAGNQFQRNESLSQKRETEIVDITSELTKDRPDAESKDIVGNTPNKSSLTINLQDKGLSPILRRAFLFIEDGEWEKADEYLERVLDEEPENAYAYLGKTLIEIHADSIEQLNNSAETAINSRNYIKALRYSNDELREYLKLLGSQMNESGGESTKSNDNAL